MTTKLHKSIGPDGIPNWVVVVVVVVVITQFTGLPY